MLARVPLPLLGQSRRSPAKLPDPSHADVAVQGYVFEPKATEPAAATAGQLRVTPGVEVTCSLAGSVIRGCSRWATMEPSM